MGEAEGLDQSVGGEEQEGPTSLASHSPNSAGQTLETRALLMRRDGQNEKSPLSPDQG